MCEACHIVPFVKSDNANMYNVNNGLLLSANLHELFDKHLISVNMLGIVVLSSKVLSKDTFKNYHKYDDM